MAEGENPPPLDPKKVAEEQKRMRPVFDREYLAGILGKRRQSAPQKTQPKAEPPRK